MDTPLQPAPQSPFNQPQYSNPPPQSSGGLTGPIIIALVLLLVGGGIVWALTRSSDSEQPQATETPEATQAPNTTATPRNTLLPQATATPNPTQAPTTVATFLGRWSGRFNGSGSSCPDGNVFFDVFANGTIQGTATTDFTGFAYSGGGNVSAAGNISGGWVYGPALLNLTGKLLANGSGSGTWSESAGCSGTFSVQR